MAQRMVSFADEEIPVDFFFEFYSKQDAGFESRQQPCERIIEKTAHHLSGYLCNPSPTLQTHLQNMYTYFQMDEELFLMAVIILYRYMGVAGSSLNITKDSELFYLFVLCIIVSLKGLLDAPISTGSIARMLNLEPERIFHNERQILEALHYDLCFSEADLRPDLASSLSNSRGLITSSSPSSIIPSQPCRTTYIHRRGSLTDVFPLEGLMHLAYARHAAGSSSSQHNTLNDNEGIIIPAVVYAWREKLHAEFGHRLSLRRGIDQGEENLELVSYNSYDFSPLSTSYATQFLPPSFHHLARCDDDLSLIEQEHNEDHIITPPSTPLQENIESSNDDSEGESNRTPIRVDHEVPSPAVLLSPSSPSPYTSTPSPPLSFFTLSPLLKNPSPSPLPQDYPQSDGREVKCGPEFVEDSDSIVNWDDNFNDCEEFSDPSYLENSDSSLTEEMRSQVDECSGMMLKEEKSERMRKGLLLHSQRNIGSVFQSSHSTSRHRTGLSVRV